MAARISPYVTAGIAGADFWLAAAHSVPGSAAARIRRTTYRYL